MQVTKVRQQQSRINANVSLVFPAGAAGHEQALSPLHSDWDGVQHGEHGEAAGKLASNFQDAVAHRNGRHTVPYIYWYKLLSVISI